MQAAFVRVAQNQFIKSRFVNGDVADAKALDFCLIYIDAGHVDAHFCKAGAGNQTDITCSNYCYLHRLAQGQMYGIKEKEEEASSFVDFTVPVLSAFRHLRAGRVAFVAPEQFAYWSQR